MSEPLSQPETQDQGLAAGQAPTPVAKLVQLPARQFSLAQHARNHWYVTTGAKPEQVLMPGFWAHVAKNIRAFDLIEVVSEAGTWRMELFVRFSDRTSAVCEMVSMIEFDRELEAAELPEDLYVVYRGPHLKYCVMRKGENGNDSAVIEGVPTQLMAQRQMLEYARKTA